MTIECHIREGVGRCFEITLDQLRETIVVLMQSVNVVSITILRELLDYEDCECCRNPEPFSEDKKPVVLRVHYENKCVVVPFNSETVQSAIAEFINTNFLNMDLHLYPNDDSINCTCAAEFVDFLRSCS